LAIEIHTCPAGTPLESIQVEPCAEPLDGTEILLDGDALADPLSLRDATGDGPAPTWTNLPYGEYCLLVSNMSNGHNTVYAFSDAMPATVAVAQDGVAAACLSLPGGGSNRQDVDLYLVTGSRDDPAADPVQDADSDGDGITDADEIAFGSDPDAADTDGDGFWDGDEAAYGADPTDAADFLVE